MEQLLNEFEEMLQAINDKASEIIKEANKLNDELKTNDYPDEERDREREVLGI